MFFILFLINAGEGSVGEREEGKEGERINNP